MSGYWAHEYAIRTYQSVVEDTPDSPQAALVPARIDALYTHAAEDAARRPCSSLGRMIELVGLGDANEPGAKSVADKSRAALPGVRYACGTLQYDKEKYREARDTLKEVTTGPYARKAADLLIAVDVADATKGSAGALPPPAAEGGAPAGTAELVVANDSTRPWRSCTRARRTAPPRSRRASPARPAAPSPPARRAACTTPARPPPGASRSASGPARTTSWSAARAPGRSAPTPQVGAEVGHLVRQLLLRQLGPVLTRALGRAGR